MSETVEYEQKAVTLADQARGFQVANQQTYMQAGVLLQDLKEVISLVTEHHAPMKEKAWAAHKAICAAEKKLLLPLQEAQKILAGRVGCWEVEQRELEDKRRREAEARMRVAAEEAREREIEQAEAEGADAEEIAAMIEAPLPTILPRVESTFQRAPGISTAKIWKAEVTSLLALVKAIATGQGRLEWVVANEATLNRTARETTGTLVVPGVRFYVEPLVKTGRRF